MLTKMRWLTGLIGVLLAVSAGAANWRWELANERYQQLDVFQRAQYDKGADMIKQRNYRGAAKEFEKFKIQFPDTPVLSYVIFMRGYALHLNKERNQAIGIYNEVLDYFGDQIDDASAALYHLGMAHIENGDIREGMEAMKEMADDEDYQKHALAAGAIRRLGDNYWKNKEPEPAVRYWKQVVRDFTGANDQETRGARNNVLSYYIKNQDYAAIDDWMIDDEGRADPAHRKWVANAAWDVAWSGFGGSWEKYTDFNKKERQADIAAFAEYFARQKDWYVKANDAWTYYSRAIHFAAQRSGDRKALAALIDEVAPTIAKLERKSERDGRYSWIIDRLREGHRFERARYCMGKLTDPALAAYKEYEVVGHGEGRWHDAANQLIEITKMGDADWQVRAEGQLAWVYKDRTHEYEKAIQVYQQINRPPGTLWGIQECHKRMGRLDDALRTLSEIENMFPDDAARAAWYKTVYQKEAGNREKAIAQARRLLKVYPRAPEASNAHQLLEEFGVATGGGVVDEE